MFKFQKKYPYYADNGVTATSANYIANLGKEYYRTILKELDDITFYTTEATVGGMEGNYVITRSTPAETFARIPEMLHRVYRIKALIAWLREAIKTREAMLDELADLTMEDYAKITEQSCRLTVSKRNLLSYSKDETSVTDAWDIDQMWDYIYGTERKEAFKGAFQDFGRRFQAVEAVGGITTSIEEVVSSGRRVNCSVYTDLTAPVDQLRSMHRTLKNAYMEVAAAVEPLEEAATKLLTERLKCKYDEMRELTNALEAYNSQMDNFIKVFRANERARLSKLRIMIPQTLQPIFDELNNLHHSESV